MIASYTISIPQKKKKKKPPQWDLPQPDVLWQIRKSEETSSPDDDDEDGGGGDGDEADECVCLLACVMQFHNKRKDKAKKEQQTKKTQQQTRLKKARVLAWLFVWFACFLDFQKILQLENREGRAVFINYYY